jgi:hypothetical protein
MLSILKKCLCFDWKMQVIRKNTVSPYLDSVVED